MLSTLKDLSKYLEELDKNEINTPVRLRSILKNVDSNNTCTYVHSFAMNICNQLFKRNNIFGERICREFIRSEIWKFNNIMQNGMVSYPDLLLLTKKFLSEYIGKRLESYKEEEEYLHSDEKSRHRVYFKAITNKRNKQEDRFLGVSNVVNYAGNHRCYKNEGCSRNNLSKDMNILFVGLFDGHNGPEAAEHCHHLAPYLISNHIQTSLCSKGRYNIIEVLGETYHSLNNTLNGCRNKYRWKAGTTSTMCLIDNNLIYTSWVGDCSAWLIYRDDTQAALTDILHRPTQNSEVIDVWNNGGVVTKTGPEYDRVNGVLAVTRALGDDRKIVGVSALPSVSECLLLGNELCIVVATDGLWDCAGCSGPEIGRMCREFFHDNRDNRSPHSSELLCQSIVDRAVRGGASDNISVVIVVIGPDIGPSSSSSSSSIDHNWQDSRAVRWPRSRRMSCFADEIDRLRVCSLGLDDYLQAHFGHSVRMRLLLEETAALTRTRRQRRSIRRARSLSQEICKRFSSPIRSIGGGGGGAS